MCETLRYPGGCASTFEKDGCRFDAGATLISGLEPQQLFGGWLARYAPETRVDFMPSILEMRAPGLSLQVGRSRQALAAQFCKFPGAPVAGICNFFKQQEAVAALLWGLFDTPELLARMMAVTPLGRFPSPEDVAALRVDASQFVAGLHEDLRHVSEHDRIG